MVDRAVAQFPPASLAAQLAELKREKKMRAGVYPHWIQTRKMTQAQADYQVGALDGAIATLDTLVRATGQPGRRELVAALREARVDLECIADYDGATDGVKAVARKGIAELDALLAKVPE